MTATHRLRHLLPALLALLISAPAWAAGSVPDRLALQLDWRPHGKGKQTQARSMSRQVTVHLVPMLEGLGFTVERVHSAKKAIKSGDYHVALQVSVDAKAMWLVHEARQFGKQVVSEHETGISAWAEFKAYGGRKREQMSEGAVGPIASRVHEVPGGRPILDDEDSVARVFAGELSDAVGAIFRDYTDPEEIFEEEDE
jgi:hypothetical protein